jgi:hypothetical protein
LDTTVSWVVLHYGRTQWISWVCNPWWWSYYWRKRVYKDHATLGSGAIVGAGSGVTCDVPAGKTVLGYPAVEARDALKQWAILISQWFKKINRCILSYS